MKFTDILALAKQGYTPADIRELMAIPTEDQQTTQVAEASETEAQTKPAEVAPIDAQTEEGKMPAEPSDGNADKIKELEDQIKRLQAENTRIARPAEEKGKTQQEILEDLARGFM